MSVLTVVGASVAAAVLSVGSVAGASVASASPTGSHDNLAARLTAVCGRVGTRIDRVEKVQARLEAGPDTPGSIARLQARIDAATKAGKSDQARLLTDRLAIRKDIESTLPDVLAHLKDAQSVCAAQVGTGTASSPATS